MKNILNNLNQNMKFKKIPVKIDHIIVNPDNRVFVALCDENDRKVGLELNVFEASMLSFVQDGFHEFSHINTIHQLFIKSLNYINTKIEEIDIESKSGDIIYCSLKLVDGKNNRAYTISSIADALILSKICKCPLFCIEETWEKMDTMDDWDYEDFIVDFDEEDEE